MATSEVVLGTDSHTTMVNGLGVLGWGTGGIQVVSLMLGDAVRLPLPPTTGVRVVGRLRPGVTATDLVLLVVERLRARGEVNRVVEFFGPGLAALSTETRLTISNVSPEYGCTSVPFPIDSPSRQIGCWGTGRQCRRSRARGGDQLLSALAARSRSGRCRPRASRPVMPPTITRPRRGSRVLPTSAASVGAWLRSGTRNSLHPPTGRPTLG